MLSSRSQLWGRDLSGISLAHLSARSERANEDDWIEDAIAEPESALRGVRRCAPYSFMPPLKYEAWKDVIVDFDPRDMFRG